MRQHLLQLKQRPIFDNAIFHFNNVKPNNGEKIFDIYISDSVEKYLKIFIKIH